MANQLNFYEKSTRKAQIQRAFLYAFLWLFLSGMIYWINAINSFDYPMVTPMVFLLAVIGLVKLAYGIYFYQRAKKGLQD